ncbi:MAG: hypothetical protein H0W08_02550, partial [Acidobacteria bacterium]|nr:hypothetical protein [Acidobacteriota bacterium]
SCCTSASSPYSAGVVALLISAARQSKVGYSLESLSRAMKVTARVLQGFQAYQQGNGALDINAAWGELATPFDPPRIVASTAIVHPLAQYAARGPEGQGILEFEGWAAGMNGTREIRLRRESGAVQPVIYRLAWSADDGTFTTPPSVTLPLGEAIPLQVNVNVKTSGAHSGLLTLHDLDTDAVVFRTQATIVASERIDPATGSLELKGTVGLMQQNAHYLQVPAGAAAIAFELEVTRGVVTPTILQSHGLPSSYYMHAHPMNIFSIGPGKYHILMPNPEPGTWTLRLKNASTWFPAGFKLGPRNDDEADYALTMRVLGSSIRPAAPADGRVALELVNEGSPIAEPVIEAWNGSLRTHRATFERNGLPNVIDIEVPADAASLSLQLRSEHPGTNTELYLYDCTTGECFSYDIAFPAARSQTLLVRKPSPGRWVAAVNAAPFPASSGSFVLDEVITTGTPRRRASAAARVPGARWREVIDNLPAPPAVKGRTPVVFFELLDAAAERAESEHPWTSHERFVKMRDRPVALGTAIYRR